MVRLEHVNKYFNRRKKNEIHVINDTTLQMENKGLVALLGPSGCGKTTLLNAVSYTHLDVYKRQAAYGQERRRSEILCQAEY